LTGREAITGRENYGNAEQFRVSGQFMLGLNDYPEAKGADGAFWRRIRCLHFPMKFVEHPKEPNERLMDPEIQEKVKYVRWK
jgi:phage/plasmid-associated DNA primase